MTYQFLENRISGGIGADDRYWESLEEGHFRLPRCAECLRWMWPAHWRCPECGCWEQEWVDVEPVGTVFAWTRTWYSFDRVRERADQVPYVVVVAEIPAAGEARVLGMLGGSEEGLEIGTPVHGIIAPPSPVSKGYATIQWVLGRRPDAPAERGGAG